jgi:hypothetical protein
VSAILFCVYRVTLATGLHFSNRILPCATIPILELTSTLLVPFIFNRFHDANFATSFFSNSCGNGGYTHSPPDGNLGLRDVLNFQSFIGNTYEILPQAT